MSISINPCSKYRLPLLAMEAEHFQMAPVAAASNG